MRIANSSFEGEKNIWKNFDVSKFKKSIETEEPQFDFIEKNWISINKQRV